MRYLVTQCGARRGYAVPLLLEQAGMLEALYTDIAGNRGVGKWLGALRRRGGSPSTLTRLAARKVPDVLVPKTKTFGIPKLRAVLADLMGKKDASSRFCRSLDLVERWGQAMIPAGFGKATHVYSMLDEARGFLAEARRRGLIVVSEVYILLSTERIVAEERLAFPGWETAGLDTKLLRQQCGITDGVPQLADYFICPSAVVQDDLVEHWGVARERTTLVPYGMNPQWLTIEPSPTRGRILFVGTAELRKGIHYLAMAAERLAARGHRYEFRVAGDVTDQVRGHPACRHLNFLGRIPRDRISEEFQAADVFVLPSLAEGSAEVTYEALASALPLVTTYAAGSVARDGVEGRIVPARDPSALADAIQQIVEDRPVRERMSRAARERAQDYTWQRYGERLLAALQSMVTPRT